MIKEIQNLRSNLDIHIIKRKQLSIQFSLDGFSFCIFDLELQEFIAYSAYTFNTRNQDANSLLEDIKKVFKQEDLLLDKYEKVLVVHVNNLSAFVPFPLFDEDNLETYIKFNNKIYNNDYFVYDSVMNQDMVSVFVPYVNVNNFLIDQYGSFEYKHYSSILVENLLNDYASKLATSFYVNVFNTHFEIIVSTAKKLVLYNTYTYNTPEDFIYYILFVMEQLKLDVEKVYVEVLGKINEESDLFTILYKYVRNVSVLVYKPKYSAVLDIDKTIQRENFILFNTID